jgi:glycosyltransferase involved in cell wall biosynthesis
MPSLVSSESRKVLLDQPSRFRIVQHGRGIPPLGQAARSIYRAGRRLARWCKKLAFFFLPPLVYSGLKWIMPRIVQAPARRELRDALARRLDGRQRFRVTPAAINVNGSATAIETSAPTEARSEIPTEYHDTIARYHDLHLMGENSVTLLEIKNRKAGQLYSQQLFDRVRLLRELARLAALRGDELLASAYRVRAIRLLGSDAYHDLPLVGRTLRRLQFNAEAEALAAMYEDQASAPKRCQLLLESALAAHRQPPASTPFERTDDCRHPENPKVAVIVSLYRAANKLPLFLHALRTQSLLSTKQVELILVDSGSPEHEYAALTKTLVDFSLPYLYVRTTARETIQMAWNRGIALARAPYLTFLGVDETVTTDALAILSDALDADPSVDWVQGDSLLTEVDGNGRWLRDVMIYDRNGYTSNHVYLETCYLSWVGAMYRRSIHERFGYYDGSFRAAGDTEFKHRVLPFISTQRIPQLLGVFLNHPEPRATASPIAELEDIRAWYLHRTLGGVSYALQRRDPCEVEKLLLLALHYRKSYVTHFSSDVEYAAQVAMYLQERLPTSPIIGLRPGIDRMLRAARAHDHVEPLTCEGFMDACAGSRDTWAAVNVDHNNSPWLNRAEYKIYQDNRYEQHSFLY